MSDTGQRVSVAALRSTPVEDVQVALRAVGDGGEAVIVEIAVSPLMQLVWWGGLLIVAGLAWSVLRSGRPAPATAAASVSSPLQAATTVASSRSTDRRYSSSA